MRSFLIGVLSVAAMGWSTASAKLYSSHEDILAAAQKSGKLVLIVYNRRLDNDASETMQMSNRMLRFAATQTANFEVAEIDPFKHQGPQLNKFIMGMREKKSISGTALLLPIWAVATPDGELIGGGDYDTIKKGGIVNWRAAVSALPRRYPRITEQERKKAEETLAEAKAEMSKNHFYKAYELAKKLEPIWYPKKFCDDRKAFLDSLEEKGIEVLAKADELNSEGKFLDAGLAYERIKRQFTVRMSAGLKAQKKLALFIQQHKDLREQLERGSQDEEAKELLDEARDLAKAGQTAKAQTAYRALTARFAQTPSAILAKDEMEKLGVAAVTPAPVTPVAVEPGGQTPKPTPADDAEAEAAKALRMAQNYRNMNLKARAIEKLKALVKKYPDTKAATEAKKMLLELGAE